MDLFSLGFKGSLVHQELASVWEAEAQPVNWNSAKSPGYHASLIHVPCMLDMPGHPMSEIVHRVLLREYSGSGEHARPKIVR
jgi:hypothetical protein